MFPKTLFEVVGVRLWKLPVVEYAGADQTGYLNSRMHRPWYLCARSELHMAQRARATA